MGVLHDSPHLDRPQWEPEPLHLPVPGQAPRPALPTTRRDDKDRGSWHPDRSGRIPGPDDSTDDERDEPGLPGSYVIVIDLA